MSVYPFNFPPGRMPQGLVKLGSSGPVFDPAAAALFAASATAGFPYSAGRKTLVNNAFVSLRSSGWLARLDRLCFPAAENEGQGLIDWITDTSYSVTGTMTFSANLGLKGDAATGYIDTGLAPSAATQFTLNKGMIGVSVSDTDASEGVTSLIGTSNITAGPSYILPNAGGSSFTSVNAIQSEGFPAGPVVPGIYIESRANANLMTYYINTAVILADPATTVALDTLTILVAATRSSGGTPTFFSPSTISGFWIGNGATNDADEAVLEGILSTYLTAIGAL